MSLLQRASLNLQKIRDMTAEKKGCLPLCTAGTPSGSGVWDYRASTV